MSAGGQGIPYARIQHEGGTIRVKNGKYLAIPLTPAAAVKRPRDWEDTFIAKGCIMRKLDGGKVEALYALKKQVTLPARPYMYIGNEDMPEIRDAIQKGLAAAYAESLRQAKV
jgi:phage gpG-like protein